jgi:hypothetical protein
VYASWKQDSVRVKVAEALEAQPHRLGDDVDEVSAGDRSLLQLRRLLRRQHGTEPEWPEQKREFIRGDQLLETPDLHCASMMTSPSISNGEVRTPEVPGEPVR